LLIGCIMLLDLLQSLKLTLLKHALTFQHHSSYH
jgi:hypothetical protein